MYFKTFVTFTKSLVRAPRYQMLLKTFNLQKLKRIYSTKQLHKIPSILNNEKIKFGRIQRLLKKTFGMGLIYFLWARNIPKFEALILSSQNNEGLFLCDHMFLRRKKIFHVLLIIRNPVLISFLTNLNKFSTCLILIFNVHGSQKCITTF